MHPTILYLSGVWTTALLGVLVVIIVRSRSMMVRILALDTLTSVLIALLGLFSAATGSSYYLDAALVLALLAFIGTLAAACYHISGRLFP